MIRHSDALLVAASAVVRARNSGVVVQQEREQGQGFTVPRSPDRGPNLDDNLNLSNRGRRRSSSSSSSGGDSAAAIEWGPAATPIRLAASALPPSAAKVVTSVANRGCSGDGGGQRGDAPSEEAKSASRRCALVRRAARPSASPLPGPALLIDEGGGSSEDMGSDSVAANAGRHMEEDIEGGVGAHRLEPPGLPTLDLCPSSSAASTAAEGRGCATSGVVREEGMGSSEDEDADEDEQRWSVAVLGDCRKVPFLLPPAAAFSTHQQGPGRAEACPALLAPPAAASIAAVVATPTTKVCFARGIPESISRQSECEASAVDCGAEWGVDAACVVRGDAAGKLCPSSTPTPPPPPPLLSSSLMWDAPEHLTGVNATPTAPADGSSSDGTDASSRSSSPLGVEATVKDAGEASGTRVAIDVLEAHSAMPLPRLRGAGDGIATTRGGEALPLLQVVRAPRDASLKVSVGLVQPKLSRAAHSIRSEDAWASSLRGRISGSSGKMLAAGTEEDAALRRSPQHTAAGVGGPPSRRRSPLKRRQYINVVTPTPLIAPAPSPPRRRAASTSGQSGGDARGGCAIGNGRAAIYTFLRDLEEAVTAIAAQPGSINDVERRSRGSDPLHGRLRSKTANATPLVSPAPSIAIHHPTFVHSLH